MTRSLWHLRAWREGWRIGENTVGLYIEDLRTGSDGRKAAYDARYRRLQLPELNEKRSTPSQLFSSLRDMLENLVCCYPAKTQREHRAL